MACFGFFQHVRLGGTGGQPTQADNRDQRDYRQIILLQFMCPFLHNGIFFSGIPTLRVNPRPRVGSGCIYERSLVVGQLPLGGIHQGRRGVTLKKCLVGSIGDETMNIRGWHRGAEDRG